MKLFFTFFLSSLFFQSKLIGQTEIDGLFMQKHYFCTGLVVSQSSFSHYWENKLHRDNLNMGTVRYQSIQVMGNIGFSDKLNFIFNIPFVKTEASAGNFQGQNGFQDLSLWLKYAWLKKSFLKGQFQSIIIGGYSCPLSRYNNDILPLSIGLGSRTTSARFMLDYENNSWFATLSGTYMYRQNVVLDRNTYYTDRIYYSHEVEMPDVFSINARTGYRNEDIIFELIYERLNTLGGFDIARNAMPFVSNNMDYERLGIHIKYETPVDGLSFLVNGFTTYTGRNIGHTNGFGLGVFYIIDMKNKKTSL